MPSSIAFNGSRGLALTTASGISLGPRFQIASVLGIGSFGTVYAARDLTLETGVAIKVLHQSSAESLYRFKREFRALRDLQHPNLARYGELLEYEGRWFFTMELIDGSSLLEYVRGPARKLDVGKLESCLRQLADGLLALHAHGLVHRDIKPSNILVDRKGRLVVLDFGLVADARDGLSPTRNVMGSVAYMSPEQGSGAALTPASDWYSAGCMLYEALTDRLPFDGTPAQVRTQKQEGLPASPTEAGFAVPQGLEALCMALLTVAPAERAGAREVLTALGAVAPAAGAADGALKPGALQRVPFVGRATELTMLDSALEQAVSGKSVGLAVLGESGVGKTALVMRAVQRCCERHAGAVVLFGRCYERESVPYNAFDGVVDELSRYLRSLSHERQSALAPRRRSALAQVFPVLSRTSAFEGLGRTPLLSGEDPQALRRAAFGSLRELFQRISESSPLAIVIDDLQWADQESLALLEELVRAPDAPHLLLAFTLRPLEECPFAVRDALGKIFAQLDNAQRLNLVGLLPDDAALLARNLTKQSGDIAASSDLHAMIDDAHGHPFFIDALLRARAHAAHDSSEPLSVETALRRVVNMLDESARGVLELLCVAAAGADLPLLSRAAQVSPEVCAAILNVLQSAKLARPARDEHAQEVEPFHDRVRVAVTTAMQRAKVESSHVRLAEALVSLARDAPERIAWHYRAAGRTERAFQYVLEAAERASSQLAFERAAQLYAEAIALSPVPDASLVERRAEALANAGKGAESGEAFRMAAALVGAAGAATRLALLRRAAEQFLRVGHLREGLEAAAEPLSGIGVSLGASPRAALRSLVVERARLALRGLRFESRNESELPSEVLERVDMLWSLGVTLSTMDHLRSTSLLARGLREALRAGEERRVSRALATEAISLAALDTAPFRRTSRLLSLSGHLAQRRGDAYTQGFHALCAAGVALAARDQFGECVQQASLAQRLFREECRGVAWELGQASLFELAARSFLGQFRELRDRAQACLREAQQSGDTLTERSMACTAAVWALLSEDRPSAAKALLHEQLPNTDQGAILVQDIYRILSEAVVGLYTRDTATFARLEGLMPALSRSLLLRVRLFRVQFLAWHARAALLATHELSRDRAAGLLHSADRDARALLACRTPQAEGHALLIRAAIARRRGHSEQELAMLKSAHQVWSARGCQPFVAAAALRMGELIGGTQRSALTDAATAFFQTEGVAHPNA